MTDKMNPTVLCGEANDSILLTDAIAACADVLESGIALLYSPGRCRLARVQSGQCLDSAGQAIDLRSTFEARLFTPDYELRWLNDYEGYGRAALLYEQASVEQSSAEHDTRLDQLLPALTAIDTLPQTYLLWGQGTGNAIGNGWSQLATARIGTLSVPLSGITAGHGVHLTTREYLTAEPDYGPNHGNVIVAEERLLQLQSVELS